ncbi:DNA-3-methyladenine glycosylase, partial [Paenibacillus durus]|uniref:DNA-3-methyladenine glycosylase n=1 Tax=Paenibacillus durus TaxID=44251 RepID=UPI0024A8B7BC
MAQLIPVLAQRAKDRYDDTHQASSGFYPLSIGRCSPPVVSVNRNDGSGPVKPLSSLLALPAIKAAPLLLGQHLVRLTEDGEIRCRIVEAESYGGAEDKGSHAYGGRRTNRTDAMFRVGGTAYVYLIYGMHHCFNIVTAEENDPHAVLIRAVEPLTPRDAQLMAAYREPPSVGRPTSRADQASCAGRCASTEALTGCVLTSPAGR